MEKEIKTEEPKNIYQRIAKVMEEVEYLQKDDKVITNQKTGAGYRAVSEEKVTGEVRKSLIKNGIVIIPVKQDHKREDEILKDQYGNDKVSRLTTVDTTYRIQNIDDKDDYIEAVSSGTGVDTQDKGIGKAMTYSYKYLFLRTFAIPTGEDTDKTSSEVYDSQFDRTKTDKEIVGSVPCTEGQKQRIREYDKDFIEKYLVEKQVKKLSDLTWQQAQDFIDMVEKGERK